MRLTFQNQGLSANQNAEKTVSQSATNEIYISELRGIDQSKCWETVSQSATNEINILESRDIGQSICRETVSKYQPPIRLKFQNQGLLTNQNARKRSVNQPPIRLTFQSVRNRRSFYYVIIYANPLFYECTGHVSYRNRHEKNCLRGL